MAVNFTYSDGLEIEARILAILRAAPDLSSSVSIGSNHYDNFAIRYHLCRQRSNLLRHLEFGGLSVLELGAGMGGVSRFLAENAKSLTAVEGSANRLASLKARLRDLNNWTAIESTIQDYHPTEKFDVVCLVGVLEYSEVYIQPENGESPFDWVLNHARSMLNPGGVLLIAIENRLGLKYWAGAAEDHTARLFDGICGYGFADSPRTFSRKRLLEMTSRCGFNHPEEFYPFPDYKLPTAVISADFVRANATVAAELANEQQSRDPRQSPQLFPESLAMLNLSGEGDFGEFANSFLVLCSPDDSSPIMQKLLTRKDEVGELAWHYSQARRVAMETRFVQSDGGLYARKVLEPAENDPAAKVRREIVSDPVYPGYRLSTMLSARAYFGRLDQFDRELEAFLKWSMRYWSCDRGRLRPEALDALATNVVILHDEYQLFDLEWKWTEPMPASWFVFRNVFAMRKTLAMFSTPRHSSLRAWYEKLCADVGLKPEFERDLILCAEFQFMVGELEDVGAAEIQVRAVMEASLEPPGYLRQPESLADLSASSGSVTHELARLRRENNTLKAEMTKTAVRIARAADRAIRRNPTLIPLLKRILRRPASV